MTNWHEKIISSFVAKVLHVETGCHEWQASTAYGYGRFWNGKKIVQAHRFSWSLANGSIPEGLCVLHRCDNKKCVNPEHLFIGTYADNSRDMVKKGRSKRGVRHWSSKLTPRDVIEIRHRYNDLHESQRSIAKAFDIVQKNVFCIVHRKTWKHI